MVSALWALVALLLLAAAPAAAQKKTTKVTTRRAGAGRGEPGLLPRSPSGVGGAGAAHGPSSMPFRSLTPDTHTLPPTRVQEMGDDLGGPLQ